MITYCFLDEDPVSRLNGCARPRDAVERPGAIEPLFAAPFHTVVPYEWDRYVP